MTHEKRITDERGRIKIAVNLSVSWVNDRISWNVLVDYIPKGKRNSTNGRDIVTPEEIHAAKMELWEKIRPVL